MLCSRSGGLRTRIAMYCGCRIFKMAAKVEKFPRLCALFFARHSSFLRTFSAITYTYTYLGFFCEEKKNQYSSLQSKTRRVKFESLV